MEATNIMLEVEALIFASEQPINLDTLSQILNTRHEEIIDISIIEQAVESIIEKYNADFYPFGVVKSGGGYQFLTKSAYHETVALINGDKFNKRLSSTAMETLSIIAYRQPITKSEVEYIRGVSSDYAIHKLLEKELIVISGRDENAVGKPLLYSTSQEFLDYLGIQSKEELPQLKDIDYESLVMPTSGQLAIPENEQSELSDVKVDENGQLNIS